MGEPECFIIGFYFKCQKCGEMAYGEKHPHDGPIEFKKYPAFCKCGGQLTPEVQEIKPPLEINVFEQIDMSEKLV